MTEEPSDNLTSSLSSVPLRDLSSSEEYFMPGLRMTKFSEATGL